MNPGAEISTGVTSAATASEPLREIAGFWRRLGAFAIDVAVLWTIGRALAYFAYDDLVRLGQNGWLVGFVVTTLYWGWCNSRLGGGGTLGKWICGIEVVDSAGERLGFSRSLWRAFVLTLPYFLPAGPFRMTWFAYFVLVVEKAIPIGALYLAACNTRNRQSIDDLAARSFVVVRKTRGPVHARPTWMIHGWIVLLIAVGCWYRTVNEFTRPFPRFETSGPEWKRAEHAMHALNRPEFDGGVGGRFFFPGEHAGADEPEITVNAEWHSRPTNPESAATQIAAALLSAEPDAKRVKQIEVEIAYGYNIGLGEAEITIGNARFSGARHTLKIVHTPEEWLRLAEKAK